MAYYVQKFTENKGGGDKTCYAEETEHNHKKSNQFTKDVKDWLIANGWIRKYVSEGKFMSGQNKPAYGREFKWDKSKNEWVAA